MIPVQQAQELIRNTARLLSREIVELDDAYGRVLAENILADRHYPPFNRAAMDGYAFRKEDFEQKEIRHFVLADELLAGHRYEKEIPSGHCLKIMTGAAVPESLDCLVQIELAHYNETTNTVSFSIEQPKHWQNIARKGEDCQPGDLILKEGTLLSPIEIATLAVFGEAELKVRTLPRVAIISTGDELVPVGLPVNDFQIRDSNAFALEAFLKAWHILVTRREIVKDNQQSLATVLQQVLDFDLVVLSGGVSMGAADYVPGILASLGVQKVFHKVQLKPGKPLWFGKTLSGGVVFGLPGNPLSCQVCFKLFIETYLRAAFGIQQTDIHLFPLIEERNQRVKLDEYFPVRLSEGRLHPIPFNGSGDVTSVVGSTGIALHPIDQHCITQNEQVLYIPW